MVLRRASGLKSMGRKFDKNAQKGPSPQQEPQQELLEDNDTAEAHLTGGGVQIVPEQDSTDEYFPISDEEEKHLSIWAQQREELREHELVEADRSVWKVWTDPELQQKLPRKEAMLPLRRPVWRDQWQPEASLATSPDQLQPPLLPFSSDRQCQKLREVPPRTRPRRLWSEQGWQQDSAEMSVITRSRSSSMIAVVHPRRPLWGNEWNAEDVSTAASITSYEKYQNGNQEQEDEEVAALLTWPTDISQSPPIQPTATSTPIYLLRRRVAGVKQKKKKRPTKLKKNASHDKENQQQKNGKKLKQQESSEQMRRVSSRETKGVPAVRFGDWI